MADEAVLPTFCFQYVEIDGKVGLFMNSSRLRNVAVIDFSDVLT